MAHLSDADVISLRDGECDSSEESLHREHLAECSECRNRAVRIEGLVDGLLAAVGEIDYEKEFEPTASFPVDPRRDSQPKYWVLRRPVRIAAVIAILLGVTLLAGPASGYVRSGWQALVRLFVPELSQSPSDAVQTTPIDTFATSDHQPVSKRASFIPESGDFSFEFAQPQNVGMLTMAMATTQRATVLVLGDPGADELVVFRSGVRIINTVTSSASYEISVPSTLGSIAVKVAGRTIATVVPSDLLRQGPWQLHLADVDHP